MGNVADIFDALGGATVISNESGIPLTTVHSWKRAGFVPNWRVPALIGVAAKLGKPLSATDVPVRGAAQAAPEPESTVAVCSQCEIRAEDHRVASCTSPQCPLRAQAAA